MTAQTSASWVSPTLSAHLLVNEPSLSGAVMSTLISCAAPMATLPTGTLSAPPVSELTLTSAVFSGHSHVPELLSVHDLVNASPCSNLVPSGTVSLTKEAFRQSLEMAGAVSATATGVGAGVDATVSATATSTEPRSTPAMVALTVYVPVAATTIQL
jgi:D-aminopeptidase